MGSGYYTKKGCVVVFFYQVLLFWLEGYRIYNMSYTHCGSVWVGSRAQMKNQTESLNLGKNKSNKSEKNLVLIGFHLLFWIYLIMNTLIFGYLGTFF